MMHFRPHPYSVIPAQAGIQSHQRDGRETLDPRLRGDDEANWDAEGVVA